MMPRRFFLHALLAALTVLLFSSPPSIAAEMPALSGGSAAPVEVSARGALVWNRKAHTYTMKDDATARQGSFQLASDTLTARYRDEKSATDIYELEAKGNVTLQSPPYTAFGDLALYDVATGEATLTGRNLRIVTPTEKLTAKDKFTFSGKTNVMTARGGATATRGTDRLAADTLTATFAKDAAGKLAVNKLTATGNVVIITLKETVYGDKGVYDIPAQKAVLTGKVRILQGRNWLQGTRADVDLKTGISQLFADNNPATQNRVFGVFYPKGQGNAAPATNNAAPAGIPAATP
jgi:lipopolysaccharide export system protein LptA